MNWNLESIGIVLSLLWNIGLTVVTLWRNDVRDMQKKISEQHAEIDGLNVTVARLEEALKGVPAHSDLSAVHKEINQVSKDLSQLIGAVGGMNDNITALRRPVDTITEYLINHK